MLDTVSNICRCRVYREVVNLFFHLKIDFLFTLPLLFNFQPGNLFHDKRFFHSRWQHRNEKLTTNDSDKATRLWGFSCMVRFFYFLRRIATHCICNIVHDVERVSHSPPVNSYFVIFPSRILNEGLNRMCLLS